MIRLKLPRYVIAKRRSSGGFVFYFNLPKTFLAAGCPNLNGPLGPSYDIACGVDGRGGRAATLNAQIDEWQAARRGQAPPSRLASKYGTVDWLFEEYRKSRAYSEKVSARSRIGYEWSMRTITDTLGKSGDRFGSKLVKSVTPRAADKLYERFVAVEGAIRLRRGEKLVMLCRKAWKTVHRLHPTVFATDVSDPWSGVTLKPRIKLQKPAVTRADVYRFAYGCIEHGQLECAAAAVICFEFLQRPENVIAGHITWTGYRPNGRPVITVHHHKNGAVIEHPLEEILEDGSKVNFYFEAEQVLAQLPRRGISMILRDAGNGQTKQYAFSSMQHIVQRMRKKLGLPEYFTLDACRHGGMTELEEASLTDGQGRALSGHRTRQSYIGYAKRTDSRLLAATRKRFENRLANDSRTKIQNSGGVAIQNVLMENDAKR